jgi:signal transduction histidine kinase
MAAMRKIPGGSGSTASNVSEDVRPSSIDTLQRQVVALQRISHAGVLAGSVFHELNNALTPILNYAKLALRNSDPAYRDRALTQIVDAAQRAGSIIRGMLDLARPGANPGQREPTEMSRLVSDVVVLVKKDLAAHRVRLDLKPAGELWVWANPAQIQQVLLNLLINARQAMPGGGTVRLRTRKDATGRFVELSVTDSGVGIASADLRRIFDPFYSTKNAPDDSGQGGTGLGLSVCRDIIEAHHGRLRAESRLGHGSTFTVIVPACSPPATPSEHPAQVLPAVSDR